MKNTLLNTYTKLCRFSPFVFLVQLELLQNFFTNYIAEMQEYKL